MTGRDPARFRIHTALNVKPAANAQEGQANFLPPNVTTLTQVMNDNGYATGHFGTQSVCGDASAAACVRACVRACV